MDDSEPESLLMQWTLTDRGPLDGQVHIQVGTTATGYYVDHTGFGLRRFPDKQTAWDAIKGLMQRHGGEWHEVACDRQPFTALRPPDGSRVLYDTGDNCLQGHWGDLKGSLWTRYLSAMSAGDTFRRTEAHALLGGHIEAVTYIEPDTGIERHAVVSTVDSTHRVVDYPDRAVAESAYEREVYANWDADLPYRSSDLRDITVDRRSAPPEGLMELDDGSVMHEDDHEYLYGAPIRMTWPRTPALANPARVRGMTADPRGWGPGEARLDDVTPLVWECSTPELRPNALTLLTLADGRQLLASAHDGSAHVWSARDGSSMLDVTGHSGRTHSVALTELPDGQVMLATGGQDGFVRVWTVPDGEPMREIKAHRSVNAVGWVCPPGEIPWLVTGSDDATVQIWDPDTGRSVAMLEVGKPSVDIVWSTAATVLADGHVCVVAGVNDFEVTSSVYVWDATSGKTLHTLRIDQAESTMPHVAVVPLVDRSFRVAVAIGPTVRVWDGLTGDIVRTFSLPNARHSAVALAGLPDLRVAVAATNGDRTVVWDSESGSELATVTGERAGLTQTVELAAQPDGGLLLAVGGRGYAPARLLRLDL